MSYECHPEAPPAPPKDYLILWRHVSVLLKIYNSFKIYLFLSALGLRCCVQAFSSWGEWGLFFVVVRRLLTLVASLVAEHRL